MNPTRIAGIALIVGALAGVVTMSFHPTARDFLQSSDQGAHAASRDLAVHWLALASLPLLVVGFLGLSRLLGLRMSIVSAALVTYAFASFAIMVAAVLDGLVASAVARQIFTTNSAEQPAFYALMRYTGLLNRSFASVYVVASSVAMLLWSIAILRAGALARGAGTLGSILGVAALLAFASGHLRFDPHGFLLLVGSQSIWTVLVGVLLCRAPAEARKDE